MEVWEVLCLTEKKKEGWKITVVISRWRGSGKFSFLLYTLPFSSTQKSSELFHEEKTLLRGWYAFGFGCKFRFVLIHLLFVLDKKDTN